MSTLFKLILPVFLLLAQISYAQNEPLTEAQLNVYCRSKIKINYLEKQLDDVEFRNRVGMAFTILIPGASAIGLIRSTSMIALKVWAWATAGGALFPVAAYLIGSDDVARLRTEIARKKANLELIKIGTKEDLDRLCIKSGYDLGDTSNSGN